MYIPVTVTFVSLPSISLSVMFSFDFFDGNDGNATSKPVDVVFTQALSEDVSICEEVCLHTNEDIHAYKYNVLNILDIPVRLVKVDVDQNYDDYDIIPHVYEGGYKIWECSIDLATYFVNYHKTYVVNGEGKSVLELGCGQGVPGLIAQLLG